jgi:hypothetical protein
MSKVNGTTPGKLEKELQQALAGVQSVLQAGQTYLLGRANYTGLQMAQAITAWLAVFVGARDAKTALMAAIRQRRDAEPLAKAFLGFLRALVSSQYGDSAEELLSFGFKPKRKPTPLTPEQRVMKKAKLEATRKKRGTLGSRQKKLVHGETPASITITSDGGVQPEKKAP